LLAGLGLGVDGARALATQCLAALGERDWFGDDDRTDQLASALGEGPAPMLRPLAVPLDELAIILEGDPLSGGGRIDLKTGEVWHAAAIDYEREMSDHDPEEDEPDPDRWLLVECEGSQRRRTGPRCSNRGLTEGPAAGPSRGGGL
jgi:hypothetical protein